MCSTKCMCFNCASQEEINEVNYEYETNVERGANRESDSYSV